MIRFWTKRGKLLIRIAKRASSHAESLDKNDPFAFKDYVQHVLEQYSDDMLMRIDAYQRQSFDRMPLLPQALPALAQRIYVAGYTASPETHEAVFDQIDLVTASLEKVIQQWGDPAKIGHKRALGSTGTIIENMVHFLMHSVPWNEITEAQRENLIAVSFLRLQYGEDADHPLVPRFEWNTAAHVSVSGWLTAKALSGEDPEDILHEHSMRSVTKGNIDRMLGIGTVPDNMCDYSDEVLTELVKIRQTKIYRFIQRSVIEAGATENTVREVMLFSSILGLAPHEFQITLSLHKYKALSRHYDYTLAPHAVRDQCVALLTVACAMNGVYGSNGLGNEFHKRFNPHHGTLTDERLIQLLLDHPMRADRIATAIRERNVYDFESLEQLSDTVLSEGML